MTFRKSLKGLSEREQKVISYRFGLIEPKTLEDTGREFGVTRERIRQIEAKALEKVNFELNNEKSSDEAGDNKAKLPTEQ